MLNFRGKFQSFQGTFTSSLLKCGLKSDLTFRVFLPRSNKVECEKNSPFCFLLKQLKLFIFAKFKLILILIRSFPLLSKLLTRDYFFALPVVVCFSKTRKIGIQPCVYFKKDFVLRYLSNYSFRLIADW